MIDDVASGELVLIDIESDRIISAEVSAKDVADGNDEDGKAVSVAEVGGPSSCLLSLVISRPLAMGREAVNDQSQSVPRPDLTEVQSMQSSSFGVQPMSVSRCR